MSNSQSIRRASRSLLDKFRHIFDAKSNSQVILQASGHCPTCERDVDFMANNNWLRDHFVCTHCGSIPRERALMVAIDSYFPKWREAVIHESSPGQRGASLRLSKECSQYIPSQYLPDHRPGTEVGAFYWTDTAPDIVSLGRVEQGSVSV